MPLQKYDIILGGTGYMVAPKTYKRGLDTAGVLGSAPVRQVQTEWAGGLRPAQMERDRFHNSLGLLPMRGAGGAGVGAGPKEAQAFIAGLHATARRYGIINAGCPYVAAGGDL